LHHYAPTAFLTSSQLATANRELSFVRDPGEIVAIGLDANQHSRTSLDELREKLLTALNTGSGKNDYIADIDELLSYTAANYWYKFNRDNANITKLTNTIGTQQWVGSGIVSAKPDLLTAEGGAFVIDYLPYLIAPVDMGVDLPNSNNPILNATTGTTDREVW